MVSAFREGDGAQSGMSALTPKEDDARDADDKPQFLASFAKELGVPIDY